MKMLKKLMVLFSCLSLLVFVACGSDSEITAGASYDSNTTDTEIDDVSLITSPNNGSEVEPEENEEGNPAYDGEADDVSLVTSPNNGSEVEPEEDEEGNPAYDGEADDVSLVTSPNNGLEREPEDSDD